MAQDKMKTFLVLSVIFLAIHGAAAVTHSLQYFYTASSGVKDFPEFVTVGMVDGQPFTYYDSDLKKEIPKQDWMAKNEGPEYWESQTQVSIGTQQSFKANIEIAKQRFNQTRGVHIVQNMYGCEWDDETGEVKGFDQFGYDGEDFLLVDLKTETWIAPKQQAVMTKHKFDHNKAHIASEVNYFTEICPEYLKKYVNYGKASLLRTDLPSVSVLQKPSSSLVRCLATGFYPSRAEMFWRKDGEEIHEGVERGEILPNNDGTFQMSVSLDLPSEKPGDWMKYECVFQLSGVNEDVIKRLEKPEQPEDLANGISTGLVIGVVVGLLVLVIAGVGVGVWYWKRQNDGFKKANFSDTSSASSEDSIPKKGSSEQKPMLG